MFDALFRIIREEGLFTLWRGAIPTMGRAMVVNAAQLASYSQAKQALLDTGVCREDISLILKQSHEKINYYMCYILNVFVGTGYFEENILLHFASSMISGLVTTAASMPVDIAKTR